MVTHNPNLAGLIPRQINIVNGRIATDNSQQSPLNLPLPAKNGRPVFAGVNGKFAPSGSRVMVGSV